MNRFFITHGRGLNEFVKNELNNLADKFNYDLKFDDLIEGKITFTTNIQLEKLIKLKTIERLFLSILFKKFQSEASQDTIIQLIKSINNFNLNSEEFIYILDNFSGKKLNFKENLSKKQRQSIKYRIDCKLTGKWKRDLEFKEKLIQNLTKIDQILEIDLKEPDFVLTCHLTDISLAIGIPVTKKPISSRDYIKHVGLRSTICEAMIQLAGLRSKNDFKIILDPFCGKSTILTEYLKQDESNYKNEVIFLSSDSIIDQLKLSIENVSFNNMNEYVDFICTNFGENLTFPYRDNLVDLIITDLPFGKNHSIQFFKSSSLFELQSKFFNKILNEFSRLINKKFGTIVLLINSNEIKIFEEICVKKKDEIRLKIEFKYQVSLGETCAYIIKLVNS